MQNKYTRTQNLESTLLQLVNQERQNRKKPPLSAMSDITEVAALHSIEMLHFNDIYHDSPKTGSVGDRVKRAGLPFLAVAENVAMGGDLQKCHVGLMNSPGHRKNILNKSYTHVGMGVVRDQKGILFITQVFMEQLPVLDIAEEKQKAINKITELRSKRNLPPLAHIELDATNQLTTKISKMSTQQLQRLDVNPTISQIGKELAAKKMAYRQLSLTWQTGKSLEIKSVRKELLSSKLRKYSLGVSVNKQLGCLCIVYVFIS